jgi:hypothetical protein
MKIENEVDICTVRTRGINERIIRGIAFAKEIWPRMQTLVGSERGILIDIREDYPDRKEWPTVVENKALKFTEQMIRVYHYNFKPILNHLNELLREKTRNNNQRYFAATTYAGGGKVVLWWKYVKPKAKKKTPSA